MTQPDPRARRRPGGVLASLRSRSAASRRAEPEHTSATPARQPALAPPLDPRYPHLRLGSLGALPGWPSSVGLADHTRGPAERAGDDLDLLLVPGPSLGGPHDLDADTRARLTACVTAAVPTVLVAGERRDLDAPTATVSRGIVATSPALGDAAAARFGPERGARVPVVLDLARLRPTRRPVAGLREVVVLGRGTFTPPEGLHAATSPTDDDLHLAAERRDHVRAHALAAVVVEPAGTAAEQRTAAALAALGVPVLWPDPPDAVAALVEDLPAEHLIDRLTAWRDDPVTAEVAAVRARQGVAATCSVGHHLDALLPVTGIPAAPPPSVTVLAIVTSLRELPRFETNLRRQTGVRVDAVLAVDTGDAEEVANRTAAWDAPVTVVALDPVATTADRLNLASHRASGDHLAVFEERARYAAEHLSDGVHARTHTGAEVVGRSDRFVHDADRDVIARLGRGTGDRDADRLAPGSLVLSRALVCRLGFRREPGPVDRSLIARAVATGGRAHAIHPYGALLPGRLPSDRPELELGRDAAIALPTGDGGVPDAAEAG